MEMSLRRDTFRLVTARDSVIQAFGQMVIKFASLVMRPAPLAPPLEILLVVLARLVTSLSGLVLPAD